MISGPIMTPGGCEAITESEFEGLLFRVIKGHMSYHLLVVTESFTEPSTEKNSIVDLHSGKVGVLTWVFESGPACRQTGPG